MLQYCGYNQIIIFLENRPILIPNLLLVKLSKITFLDTIGFKIIHPTFLSILKFLNLENAISKNRGTFHKDNYNY